MFEYSVYIYIHIYIFTCLYLYIYACMSVYIYICICVYRFYVCVIGHDRHHGWISYRFPRESITYLQN